jgi:hypothetical protein
MGLGGTSVQQLKNVASWSFLGIVALVLCVVAVYLVFLLPGAATLFAWDCFADAECSLRLQANRGTPGQLVRADHAGAMAWFMGGLMGTLALVVVGGVSRTLVTVLRKDAGPGLIVAAAAALLALDVALVSWLNTLI